MAARRRSEAVTERYTGEDARARLLSGLPVCERRLQLAGASTAVLEGGDGPPIVLLQGEFAAVWMRVDHPVGGARPDRRSDDPDLGST